MKAAVAINSPTSKYSKAHPSKPAHLWLEAAFPSNGRAELMSQRWYGPNIYSLGLYPREARQWKDWSKRTNGWLCGGTGFDYTFRLYVLDALWEIFVGNKGLTFNTQYYV